MNALLVKKVTRSEGAADRISEYEVYIDAALSALGNKPKKGRHGPDNS
jgi:hypothetical protein